MVRVFIKGGVWKNSEDEILKAAVMKYGKQQWARVASLLNRKSAKQCKARWNEWLDPSVRKVEWSRAEEERLLHLAKLLPAQWRTIGPLIGRTAGQCQERYERLLDEAAAAAGDTTGADGTTAVAAAAGVAAGASSARRLRPGEIDPHPETRPARPDPIDMDEDEIEMLQEARARLANTQGKKAKRKQREKMLAEAKRLADLQKRRELKQAGLLSSAARSRLKKRNRREIDLGVEIPFHKMAPAGFHDVREEKLSTEHLRKKRLRDVDYKKLNEDRFRTRDLEAEAAQKREESRLRALERANLQLVEADAARRKKQAHDDPMHLRKRGVLTMPKPMVSDEELAKVAKLSTVAQRGEEGMAASTAAGSGGGVTDALLGDYTDRPLPTPMRTPASTASSSTTSKKAATTQSVMREAQQLRMLERGQTPLLGGENPPFASDSTTTAVGHGMDMPPPASTAHVDAPTPRVGPTSISATPLTHSKSSSTTTTTAAATSTSVLRGGPTPLRDALGLNLSTTTTTTTTTQQPPSMLRPTETDDDAASTFTDTAHTFASYRSIKEAARAERRAAKRARRELEMALADLPAPQYDYEFTVPSTHEDNLNLEEDEKMGAVGQVQIKDRAEEEEEALKELQRQAKKLHEQQSKVLQRGEELPRPRQFKAQEELRKVEGVFGELQRRAASFLQDVGSSSNSKEEEEEEEEEGGFWEEYAEALLQKEMLLLMAHDAHEHPLPSTQDVNFEENTKKKKKQKKKKKKDKKKNTKRKREHQEEDEEDEDEEEKEGWTSSKEVALEYVEEEALEEARAMLTQEADLIFQQQQEEEAASHTTPHDEPNKRLMHQNVTQSHYHSTPHPPPPPPPLEALCQSLQQEYETLQTHSTQLYKKNQKRTSKLMIHHGGYHKRAALLHPQTLDRYAEFNHACIEYGVYERLYEGERVGVEYRVQGVEEEVRRWRRKEEEMQKGYGELMHEKQRLLRRREGLKKKKKKNEGD